MRVAIIDYGSGNLRSATKAFERAAREAGIAAEIDLTDRPERVALVMGSEGDGLSRTALDSADTVVTIPMSGGVDSLNVASAAAVALWALSTS